MSLQENSKKLMRSDIFLDLGRVNNDVFSDNESVNEVASVHSLSDAENGDDVQQTTPAEKYEEKMLQLIENCAEKSAKIRIPALKSMCETMQHRFISDFIVDRKITVIDIIEKSLRRGKSEEQELAARLTVLLIIQIGADSNDFKTACQILLTSINNPVCLQSLAMFYFLSGEDINEIVNIMFSFEQIFTNGDKTSPIANEALVQLHVEAMGGWSLLATLIPPSDFCLYISNGMILR